MIRVSAFYFCLIIALPGFSKKWNNNEKFNEVYRPQYHFSIESNRLGAPVSLVKKDSLYHLFYKLNPHNFQNAWYDWGHASSPDLLHWNFHESVLTQPDDETDSLRGSPWWGTVISHDHTFSAFFNSWGKGIYKTAINDEFVWWKKEKVSGADDFQTCEPFVFWHEQSRKWVMVAYNRADSTVNILNSEDGADWHKTSSFFFRYGFPGLIELPVDRKPDDTRWMFFTEKGNYLLANFDGHQFELLTSLKKMDYGKTVGATICFNETSRNRHVIISELQSEPLPDLPSNGQLSFPTEISLRETSAGLVLCRKPIDEIKTLFGKSAVWQMKKIYPGINNNILSSMRGNTYHIKGEIDLLNCDQFGLVLRCDRNNDGTEINYHAGRKLFSAFGNQIPIDFLSTDNKFRFELLIDRSSVEIFLDDGRYVLSTTFSPLPENNRYFLYTIGGEIMVEYLEVNELKPVWSSE